MPAFFLTVVIFGVIVFVLKGIDWLAQLSNKSPENGHEKTDRLIGEVVAELETKHTLHVERSEMAIGWCRKCGHLTSSDQTCACGEKMPRRRT